MYSHNYQCDQHLEIITIFNRHVARTVHFLLDARIIKSSVSFHLTTIRCYKKKKLSNDIPSHNGRSTKITRIGTRSHNPLSEVCVTVFLGGGGRNRSKGQAIDKQGLYTVFIVDYDSLLTVRDCNATLVRCVSKAMYEVVHCRFCQIS